jgi:hypothetical protein
MEEIMGDAEPDDDMPELELQGEEDESDDEAEDDEDEAPPMHQSARQAVGVKPPERY